MKCGETRALRAVSGLVPPSLPAKFQVERNTPAEVQALQFNVDMGVWNFSKDC